MPDGKSRQLHLRDGDKLLQQHGLFLHTQLIEVTQVDIQKISQVAYLDLMKICRASILLNQGSHVANSP
jgi:hypothetical protein